MDSERSDKSRARRMLQAKIMMISICHRSVANSSYKAFLALPVISVLIYLIVLMNRTPARSSIKRLRQPHPNTCNEGLTGPNMKKAETGR